MINFADFSIRHKLLLVYSLLFLLAFSLAGGIIYVFVKNQIRSSIETELQSSSQTLLSMVSNSADVSIKHHLRAVAEKNREIAAHFHQLSRQGVLGEAEAKERAKQVFKAQTIGTTGYVYCLDSVGTIVMHPHQALLGADLSSHAFIRKQLERRHGYLEYSWKNPGETAFRAKALYMTAFEPWDWIISASSYREEFNELVNVQDLKESILSLHFGKSGYSFVLDSTGELIIHPALEGENILEIMTPANRGKLERLVHEESGTIIYPWRNPGEETLRQKMVNFHAIPEFDWVVASSIYLDEFTTPLSTVGQIIAATMAIVLLLVIPITSTISSSITNPLQELMSQFHKGAQGDHSVRMRPKSRDEVGMLSRYFNTFMDHLQVSRRHLEAEISDRKLAEESIRKSEVKYRELVQNANSIILRVDMQGRITFFNEFAQSLFGYREDEILGRTSLGTIMPETDSRGQRSRDLLELVAGEPERYQYYETENMRRNGERLRVAWTNKAVRNAGGQIVEVLCIGHDITESRLKEQEMAQMRLYLKHIVDAMPSLLVSVDHEERITQWNREATRLTGIEPDQAQGQLLTQTLPQLQSYLDLLQQALEEDRTIVKQRVRFAFQDGEHFMDVMIYPIVFENTGGGVIRLDDVTSRMRMEEVMVQTEKMMSVGGLAAGMAHEINNPLGGILQNVQNIFRRLSDALPGNRSTAETLDLDFESLTAYLEQRNIFHLLNRIKDSGERASTIVNNMLTFSRNSQSRKQPVNLAGLINKTIELAAHDYDLKKRYDFRNIQIVRRFDDDLPHVPCVATEMEQVVLNLLRNAAQALAEGKLGGSRSQIVLRLSQQDHWAVIEVEDNGPGMDESTRKRVFEPFFTTKEIGLGTGLGLSVAYFIVTNNHNGSIRVESEPGSGTRFIISVPMARYEFVGL